MKNYENDYEKIRSTFVMDDRDAHPFNPSSKSFEKDAIEYALRRAFRDFNFRTLTAIKSDASEGFVCEFDTWQKTQNDAKKLAKDGKQKNEIPVSRTDYLVEKLSKVKFCTRFAEYFQDNSPKAKDAFDYCHNEMCDLFLNTLTSDYEDLSYGKAQKIVNMMFKHLYCLNGSKEYDDRGYFKHCHLTLDSFTLEWFKRNVVKGGKVGTWSNLEYKGNNHNAYTYYLEKIDTYFKKKEIKEKYNNLTPFQFEFYMWPEMQLELAAEAFFFAYEDKLTNSERKDFREQHISAKIEKIKELLLKNA